MANREILMSGDQGSPVIVEGFPESGFTGGCVRSSKAFDVH